MGNQFTGISFISAGLLAYIMTGLSHVFEVNVAMWYFIKKKKAFIYWVAIISDLGELHCSSKDRMFN